MIINSVLKTQNNKVNTVNTVSNTVKINQAQPQNSTSQEAVKPDNAEKVTKSKDFCNIVETPSEDISSQISTPPPGTPSKDVTGLLLFTSTNKDPEKVICRNNMLKNTNERRTQSNRKQETVKPSKQKQYYT